jgi:hypothetical protein
MANKRTVVLKGDPEVNEDGVASATVKPGYLVAGHASIAHQASAGADCERAFAMERSELGAGIDDTYRGSGTISAYYASGDTVKVAVCDGGDEVTAFVASGQNIADGSYLEAAGDGTLKLYNAGVKLAVALEAHAPNVVSGDAAIRVRIM